MTLTRWMGGALAVTACGSSAPTQQAPMLAQPDKIVVHVSPDAIRSKGDPINVTCPGVVTRDPSPISREELDAALARIPPTEQQIEVHLVQGLPLIDGRLHVQGRGRGFINGGSPWNIAISYASGQPLALPSQNLGAQLEIDLPTSTSAACEDAAKNALQNGKTLEVSGVGHFRTGPYGSSMFGLFLLDRVTTCSVRAP